MMTRGRVGFLAIGTFLALSGLGAGQDLETDFGSRYVFRGVAYSPGPVSQSSASITVSGLTLYAWGNVLLGGETQQHVLSEMDFGVSYARSWKAVTLEPALDAYVYRYRPDASTTTPSTAEASLKLSRAIGATSIFTKQIVDLVGYPGAYYGEAGLSREQDLSGRTTLAAALSLGWASAAYNQAFGVPHPALNVLALEVSLAHAPTGRLALKPHVEISYICDRQLRQRLASGLLVNVGLSVSVGR